MAAASARSASGCLKPPNSPHEVWNLPLIARYCRPVFAKYRARSGNRSYPPQLLGRSSSSKCVSPTCHSGVYWLAPPL